MDYLMNARRIIAVVAFLTALSGCHKEPQVCDAPDVHPSLVRGIGVLEGPAAPFFAELRLADIQLVKVDKSTGTSDCHARLIIPTDAGPYDHPIDYRVGPSNTGQMVFMYYVMSDDLIRFVDAIQAGALRRGSPKG
jgi:hypothetical protein